MKRFLFVLFSFSSLIFVFFFSDQPFQRWSKKRYGTLFSISLQKPTCDTTFALVSIKPGYVDPPLYPWKNYTLSFSPITKEYFRCKGSPLNPPVPSYQNGTVVTNIFDCCGKTTHSLPIRNKKEFIYPILIELLNHIQQVMKKAVVITSGHRCPIHNQYIDSSIKGQFSKHLIGAEVNFYVKGAENSPDAVLTCIEDFYRSNHRYIHDQKAYFPFVRYEKKSDTSIKPWMNKEIFLKFYLPTEGRNGDNNHPYGYFSLQVRFDHERQLQVSVTAQDAELYERY